MVIRNKEERSHSIWRFIGVALIPLLLLFVAGFTLGNTAEKEQGDLKAKYEEEAKKSAALEARIRLYEQFFAKGDSLLKGTDDKMEELSKQLQAATETDDMTAVSDWEDDKRKVFQAIKHGLDDLEIEIVSKNSKDEVLTKGLHYFREFERLSRARMDLMKVMKKGGMREDQLDDLKALEEEMRKKNEEQEKEIKQGKTDLEMSKLQDKLDKCNEALDKCRSGKTDNSGQKKAIQAELNKIRNEVIPNMQAKWIGNDKDKINRLKEQLRNSVDAIDSEAKDIQ